MSLTRVCCGESIKVLISVYKSLFYIWSIFIKSNLFEAKHFTLNANSKDLEFSFSRIYPIISPYFINNKIHDSSIFYVITSLWYIVSHSHSSALDVRECSRKFMVIKNEFSHAFETLFTTAKMSLLGRYSFFH